MLPVMCNAEKPNYFKMRTIKITLLIFLMTIGKYSISQEFFTFPDSNATWNTVGHNIFSGYNWNFRYAIYGDTVINSTLYQKVYEMYDSTILNPYSTYFAAIRENANRQVFCLIPGFNESILYDFNLESGDTIFYHIGAHLCENNLSLEEHDHFKVVTATDSILLENNQYRKSWILESFLGDTWVEGVGSINFYGLFNPLIYDITLCGDIYTFACFKHNDTVLYLDNPNCNRCFCQLITSIDQNEKDDEILLQIIPNPASSKVLVRIDIKDNSFNNLLIYNNLGELVFYKKIETKEFVIRTDNYKHGLYLVQVFDSYNRIIGSRKLIIE